MRIVAEFIKQIVVRLALVISAGFYLVMNIVQLTFQSLNLSKCLIGFFQNGTSFHKINILFQKSDAYIFIGSNASGIGFKLA